MSSDPADVVSDELLARLERFEIDEPGIAFPFVARLARENGWSAAFAGRVVREYKRFVFLAVVAGHPVTPSEAVDQAWHLHLVHTRSYWDRLCGEVLGRPLHHDPTQGGAAEASKFHDWYARTLESYRARFGESPPPDIWPAPAARFADAGRSQWVDRARSLVIPLPFALRRRRPGRLLGTGVAVGIGVALLLPACAGRGIGGSPLAWADGPFLALYVLLLVLAVPLGRWLGARVVASSGNDRPVEPPTDALEMAMLAGGPARVRQAAVARLVAAGSLELVVRKWRWNRLRVTGEGAGAEHEVERAVLAAAAGRDGVAAGQFLSGPVEGAAALGVALELQGLRLGASDGRRARLAGCAPVALLLAFGAVRLLKGLTTGEPVAFLVVLMVATVIVGSVLAAGTPRLTSAGLRVLGELRRDWSARGVPVATPAEVAVSVALLGPPALAKVAGLRELGREMERAAAAPDTGSSSGCSAGCGGSDGGSSGCGGCGGD